MIGDAYFQLRAQIGTGLFSLLRLAAESGAKEETQAALRGTQNQLRETFTFAALGPQGSGKSTLLNALFGRDFCGSIVEPATAGRLTVFQYGEAAQDSTSATGALECRRPHIFLRDFTVIEAPVGAPAEALGPQLARSDVIFYVINAARSSGEIWDGLSRLGRDVLKRLVFVVWQCDRVSSEEGTMVVKRLRQAMLRNLAQACPIFTGAKSDAAGREKLERWIETEIILSAPRRARLREIADVARAALREIVARPRAERQALDREIERLRQLHRDLEGFREQANRHVAGTLWTLAQSFENSRRSGESLLEAQLPVTDLFWKRRISAQEFAHEVEVEVHASFSLELHDQLLTLETELKESAAEQIRGNAALAGNAEPPKMPDFPTAALEEKLAALDTPIDPAKVVGDGFTEAVRLIQMPAMAAVAAIAAALGVAIAGDPSNVLLGVAVGVGVFAVVVAKLLRRNIIAGFGRHFTANRTALLSALEPVLRRAAEDFYAGFVPALDARAAQLATERARGEPLIARLQQIEETFSRLDSDLHTGLDRPQLSTDANT